MILSFDKENCDKRNFPAKILAGSKTHTCRIDKHRRWKVGMKIQYYRLNPRNGGIEFATGIVSKVENIKISVWHNWVSIGDKNDDPTNYTYLSLEDELNEFAKNDGFNSWEELKEYFKEFFEGVRISWDLISVKPTAIQKH